jgi:hypothetical protein
MMKIVLGAALALALQLGATDVSFAQGDAGGGDGLDKRASAQGNGRTGGMHSFQRNGAGHAHEPSPPAPSSSPLITKPRTA